MIAVIAAMDSEVSAIVSKMNAEAKKIHGIEFYEGTLENKDVVVMKSGVGKAMQRCPQRFYWSIIQ